MSARSDGVAASPEMGWMRAAAVEDCESWIVWVVLRALLRRCIRSLGGTSRISAARTARSAQSSRGRGWVRRSTATSCHSTSNSASLDAADRPSMTSQPQNRTKMR
jgi:hypothetical protein